MSRKATWLWALFGVAAFLAVLGVVVPAWLLFGPYGPPAPWRSTVSAGTHPPSGGPTLPPETATGPTPSAAMSPGDSRTPPPPTPGAGAYPGSMPPAAEPTAAPPASSTSTPTPTPVPPDVGTETARRLAQAGIPPRDLVEIAGRLRLGGTQPPRTVPPDPAPYVVGRQDRFWILDTALDAYRQITATLHMVSPHLYLYVAEGAAVDTQDLQSAADAFEKEIYPAIQAIFGSEWSPGVDGDPHIFILHAEFEGAPGYFSSLNEVPVQVNATSNQHEMFCMNLNVYPVGSPAYLSTLAHEYQHLVHWSRDPRSDAWLDEGMAQMAEQIVGYDPIFAAGHFLHHPDLQLTTWAQPGKTLPHYAASYLYVRYLAARTAGPAVLGSLLDPAVDDLAAIERLLQGEGYRPVLAGARPGEAFFADWTVANLLNDAGVGDGRYAYDTGLDLPSLWPETISTLPWEGTATVSPYGADYLEFTALASGTLRLSFDGSETLPLLATSAHSGAHFWWSNRADRADTYLTRRFDLRGQSRATLRYWLWYDLETDYDYAYLEVSTDGGRSWQTLPTSHTTAANPTGNNYGHGYTGTSGGATPRWMQEAVDLTPFAGAEILVRFETITDDAYNAPGLALDDVEVPEIGFFDDMESEAGWEAAGFVWVDNIVPVTFLVQLVTTDAAGEVAVQPLALDAAQRGEIVLAGYGSRIIRAVLVVAATAPATDQAAAYRLHATLE